MNYIKIQLKILRTWINYGKKMKDNQIEDNDQKLNCFPY